MPLYEFLCEQCQSLEEFIQSYKDAAPVCSKCEKEMKRVLSRTGVRTRGAGLYSLDHASEKDWGIIE